MENLLVPYQSVLSIDASRVLVLAPHPDDEVFGCGGAILSHVKAGVPLRVIIMTDGGHSPYADESRQDYVAKRQAECHAAAVLLGYEDIVFRNHADRSLAYGERLVAEILTDLAATGADLVYAPSVMEMHPDHRALGMATIEAVRRYGQGVRLALYEIGIPLPSPNLLLDISAFTAAKRAAMECFVSQNAGQRYDLDIAALNRYRTYTLPPAVTAAEAYILTSAEALAKDPFKLYQSEYARQKELGLTLDSRDVPLVSVIIRSMDRPTLDDALDSVALQTYPNIEVVVVNARGTEHKPLEAWCGRFPLRLVSEEGALRRGRAANVGMQNAQGTYLIFLDDDDLFLPEHIAKLTLALPDDTARAAYTGVSLLGRDGETLSVLDEEWDAARLRGANFLPIHAVLFERSLLDQGCCFSESLDCLEDWEFWLQVSQHTAMLHVPGVSAVYRIALGSSALSQDADAEKHIVNRAAIFEAWLPRFTSREWVQSIYWFEVERDHFSKLALDRLDEIQRTGTMLLETKQQLDETQGKLDETQGKLLDSSRHIDRLEHAVREGTEHAAGLQQTVEALVNSTSWKVTAPLRFVSRLLQGHRREAFDGLRRRLRPLARAIYFRLPPRWRDPLVAVSYRLAGPLFNGMGHYELWRQRAGHVTVHFPAPPVDALSGLVDLSNIAPFNAMLSGRIAIHAHIFYADLAPEFASMLANMPFAYDLFVSVPSGEVSRVCDRAFAKLPRLNQLTVAVVPNRGRDIAPMFCAFGEALREYDFIAHIHGKKSLYNNGATTGWREYLLSGLLGSEQQIRRIVALLTDAKNFGIVYPQNFSQLPYQANTWLSNLSMGRTWCQRLGIGFVPSGYFNFPAGSMFWARVDALRPLFDAGIRLEDFPEEAGQTDATFAHCLERLFVLTTNQSGFKGAILRDTDNPRWSSWGFEHYLARSRAYVESAISAIEIHLVVFDIFDTLLVRPFLNPESAKAIVAKRAGNEVGGLYLALRAKAEGLARQRAGRDVGLDAIYSEFARLSGLKEDAVTKLRQLEEEVEQAAVSPRPDAISLLQFALGRGKRVVLASDMYLPKHVIESMLAKHGISGWHTLYLSSDIGLRKDSGELYRHILAQESVLPAQVLVCGDNEHSDVQIPGDMNFNICHVLRATELARAVPRLGPLVDRALLGQDMNEQLALGLVVRANFQAIFYPDFDPFTLVPPSPRALGYSVLGPMVLSFVQWLGRTAVSDGIQKLYFLAREGQFLKMVYDCWVANDPQAPPAEYLVLSRRAVTVPMIAELEDIHAIAQSLYFPNQITHFVKERFGLELGDETWAVVLRQGGWSKDRLVEVIDGQIDHLKPLLLALQPHILAQSQSERPGLLAYLDQIGLNAAGKCAVVDVGYAATIQGRLNRLLERKVHGYYLLTDQRAESVSKQHNVICQGCFGHYLSIGADAPALLVKSFTLEKLLSSNDPQIVRYNMSDAGGVHPELRGLSTEEMQTQKIRAEIQKGALAFVADAIAARHTLIGDFTVPPALARALYEAFIDNTAPSEVAMLRELVLDDHYCGRGLVR